MKHLLILLTLIASKVMALEVDEKLTLRILRVSDSQKTILVNRGIEDGLAVNDHAKFYLTSGMIARGVVIKVSPSRSVWSLYRLIDKSQIETEKVMNLKIATPVKITEDPSKMLTVEPLGPPGVNSVPEPPSSSNQMLRSSESDREDLEALKAETISEIPVVGSYQNRQMHDGTWEFVTLGYYNRMSSNTTNDSTDLSRGGNGGGYDVSVGIEKYSQGRGSFFERFSLRAFLHYGRADSTDVEGTSITNTFFTYGGGINIHFYNMPQVLQKPIFFFSFTAGVGDVEERTQDLLVGQRFTGRAGFFSTGLGFKYYFSNFGVRAGVDYYKRFENYNILNNTTNLNEEITKTYDGPRVLLGLLYRF